MNRLVFFVSVLLSVTAVQSAAAQGQLSKFDRIKIEVQRVCPVSGDTLGSMGDPLKVKIGQEEIFLCCKKCTKGQISKELWVKIHRNFAAAQGICPVMEKPLPANAKVTTVNGQAVYICCPPCSKKIQADPQKYLTKVAGYYVAALKTSQTAPSTTTPNNEKTIARSLSKLSEAGRLQVAVQKICPVSGNELGSMGVPKKVRVGKMDVFLCCEGCEQGKVSNENWTKIAQNIKAAQGMCPVMEKALPANAKSAVIEGRLVFVCCPPCTKKIANDPATHFAKIDKYYQTSLSSVVRKTIRQPLNR